MVQNPRRAVVVCVKQEKDCEELLRVGQAIAEQAGCPMRVLYISPVGGAVDGERIECFHRAASRFGSQLDVLFDQNPALAAARFMREVGAVQALVRMPEGGGGFVDRLRMLLPNLTVSMMGTGGVTYNIYPQFCSMAAKRD